MAELDEPVEKNRGSQIAEAKTFYSAAAGAATFIRSKAL